MYDSMSFPNKIHLQLRSINFAALGALSALELEDSRTDDFPIITYRCISEQKRDEGIATVREKETQSHQRETANDITAV